MQVLEGEAKDVKMKFLKTRMDPRHRGILVPLEEEEEGTSANSTDRRHRNPDLHDADLQRSPGYSEFMNISLTFGELIENPTLARRLRSVFKRTVRKGGFSIKRCSMRLCYHLSCPPERCLQCRRWVGGHSDVASILNKLAMFYVGQGECTTQWRATRSPCSFALDLLNFYLVKSNHPK